jgi:hypothetical protein
VRLGRSVLFNRSFGCASNCGPRRLGHYGRDQNKTGLRRRALEKAGAVVEEKLSATARLERVQQVIDDELAFAVQQARQPGADRAVLRDAIVRLAGEVRQQLGLQFAISRTLVDLKVVKECQETVVEVIRSKREKRARAQ